MRHQIEFTDEELAKIQKLLTPPHEHYEGMNECAICDMPLPKAIIDALSKTQPNPDYVSSPPVEASAFVPRKTVCPNVPTVNLVDNATVRVMRSHDYCHFEVVLGFSNDQGTLYPLEMVDELRKQAARLVDKAVKQYIRKKQSIQKADEAAYDASALAERAAEIKEKPETDRTPDEQAILKEYLNALYEQSRDYDYED